MAATPLTSFSRFEFIPQAKSVEAIDVARKCLEDPNNNKVNLAVGPGAYRDGDGNPWVLPSVRAVQEIMAKDKTLDHEYLPLAGLGAFNDQAVKLVLGAPSPALVENRAFGVQCVGGSGAMRLAAEFLCRFHDPYLSKNNNQNNDDDVDDGVDLNKDDNNNNNNNNNIDADDVDGYGDISGNLAPSADVFVSRPTRDTHRFAFEAAGWGGGGGVGSGGRVTGGRRGRGAVKYYRYWDDAKKEVDVEGMLHDLEAAPQGSIVILHACCHNPTGSDPTVEDWHRIKDVIKSRHHLPVFDASYLGLGSGSVDADATPIRIFVDDNIELLVAISFSANFGIYNERCGCLVVVTADSKVNSRVLSQLETLITRLWVNSPNHGARIVSTILNNQAYKEDWKKSLKKMSDRILLMRRLLNEKLKEFGTDGSWDHIVSQRGFYSITGLNQQQCRVLLEKHRIYMLRNGCVNLCGLSTRNVEFVARSIHDVVLNIKDDPRMPSRSAKEEEYQRKSRETPQLDK